MKEKKFLQKTVGRPARWLMATGFALTLAVGLCVTGGISNRITAYAEDVEVAVSSDDLGDNVTGIITGNEDAGYTFTISGNGMIIYDAEATWRSTYGAKIKTIEINEGIIGIGGSSFMQLTDLTSVTVPSSVTSIGTLAFYYCEALTDVTIEADSQLTSIGSLAFSYCSGLTSISIPASVTSIGASAFASCSGLNAVTIEADSKLTSIGENIFSYCSELTAVTMPCSYIESTTEIFGDNNAITYTYLHGDEYTYEVNAEDATKHDKVYACCETVIENTTEDHTGGSYSATGNVLTESCSVCNAELGTATITCEGGDYNGASYEATVEATGTLAPSEAAFSITYKEKLGEGWQDVNGVPYEAGTYQASITLGDGEAAVTAVVEFTINKVDVPENMEKPELPSSETYNHGAPVEISCWYMDEYNFEYYFSTSTDGTAWSDWSTERPTLTNGGDSLQVKVKMTGKNYNDWTSEAVTVTLQPYEIGVTESNLSVDISDVYYTGTGQMPEFMIHYTANAESELTENVKNGVGCTVAYENNVNVSTEDAKAKMIITGDGINYKGTLTGEFTIKQADITEVATTNSGADTAGNPIWVNPATLAAPEGYFIGTEPEGTFESVLYVQETSETAAGTEVTYYLKQEETGYLSVPKTLTVYVDADAPEMSECGGNLTSTTAEFSWILTDNMSGVAECRYVFVPARKPVM